MKLELISIVIFLCLSLCPCSEAKSMIYASDNPVVVAAAAPEYPMLAFQMKAQGEVVVEIKINSSGEVIEASMVQGHELLRAPSIQAARRWKFERVSNHDTRVVNLIFNFVGFYKGQRSATEDAPIFYPPYKVEVSRSLPTININVG